MAASDYFEYVDTPEGHRHAIALDPGNEFFIARNAERRSAQGDESPAVDDELQRAIHLNPLDASAMMTLGLRAESRGDSEAAFWLEEAARVDRTYKPSWTLLNYYFRSNQYARAWPIAERCLSLIEARDPMMHPYDPAPIFDVLWHMTDNADRILAILPRRSATLLPYLAWLSSTGRREAALQVWPEALRVADLSSSFDTAALVDFAEDLIAANRGLDAVAVWNELTARNVLQGTRLDPGASVSVEDPDFACPPVRMAFGWILTPDPGVFALIAWRNLRVEFTGDEPESTRILLKILPVIPGRKYRLFWKQDASRVESSPESSSGLFFRIVDPSTSNTQICPPVIFARQCRFQAGPQSSIVRLDLVYSRAVGSTRVKGAVLLSRVNAEMEQKR